MLCSVAATCGGCPLIATPYASQLETKRQVVLASLSRHIEEASSLPCRVIPAPQQVGYRNRLRLDVRAGAPAFFNRGKSPACVVLRSDLQTEMERFRALWSSGAALSGYTHAEVRSPDLDGRPGAFLGFEHGAPSPVPACWSDHFVVGSGSADPKREAGDLPFQRFRVVDGVYQYVPVDGFMQVNSDVNALLVQELVAGAVARGLDSFADLYCGSGNFALPLLSAGLSGHGVERHPGSVRGATRAAHEQGWAGRFDVADAPQWARAREAEDSAYALLVVDAPRAGVKQDWSTFAALSSSHLAVCSCNPATLGRDVAQFAACGFSLEEICIFDMFPQTRHVETLVWLRKRTSRR